MQHDQKVAQVMVAHEEFQPSDRPRYPRTHGEHTIDLEIFRRQQILALADQVEALMSGGLDRPHKSAWSAEEVRRYFANDVKDIYLPEAKQWVEEAIRLKHDADRLSPGLSAQGK
jgi:response regulator RpfG family c-di-GMP phosphodiesterase